MTLLKKIATTSTILLAGLVLAACSQTKKDVTKDQWDYYQETKKITIGFDNTFVPMGFQDQNGKNVGFDIDLANAVFAEYGIEVDWHPITWSMKEKELDNGNIDLIWNGYSVTDERKQKVLFSDVYMETEEVLVVKKDAGIQKITDMTDKVLGAQAGSSGYEAFAGNPTVLKDIVQDKDAVQYDTFMQAFIDLKNDRINALLVDKVYANYYLAQEKETENFLTISTNLESGDFAVGARKADKTLVKNINTTFKELYKKGEFQKIATEWFGQDTASDEVKAP
ncbi:amino acid ABC transporter substrate-binding protein [Streptococcus cameli]